MAMTLAKRLKLLRTRRGLSQRALARKVKVSQPLIAQLETGAHDPLLSTLRRLAKALRVPAMELLK